MPSLRQRRKTRADATPVAFALRAATDRGFSQWRSFAARILAYEPPNLVHIEPRYCAHRTSLLGRVCRISDTIPTAFR